MRKREKREIQLPESAMQLIKGEITFKEYFAELPEEQKIRGDARLLRALLESTPDSGLSAREREVLICAAMGMTDRETAEKLDMAFETVKSHRKMIIGKMRANGITNALAIWLARGGE